MTDNRWEIYSQGESILEGMLRDVAAAKETIELEQFSFHDDDLGRRFLEVFDQKLKEGVKIRLICDGLNSRPLFRSTYFKTLLERGLTLKEYHPFNISKLREAFYRIHKKTLIIDSRIAWIGGIGLKKKFLKFRDTQLRLSGPIVMDILQAFEAVWSDSSMEIQTHSEDLKLLLNYSGFGKKQIYEWMREKISKAKTRILLSTTYFYPDRNFFQLLLDKAKEGVEVKLLLRGMGKNSEFVPGRFSAIYLTEALEASIQIYRYQPAIMHAKTALIDDWATVGSCNLDKFSFYYNLEANIISNNPNFVQELEYLFFEDLKLSNRIELREWQQRPLAEKFLEALVKPINNYL
jgi:cardiolipin synthase